MTHDKKIIGGGRGFTIIELLIVVAIIGMISAMVTVGFDVMRKKTRDAKRLADMRQLDQAINIYFDKFNDYPPSDTNGESCGGWDTTADGRFISVLAANGIISKDILDPVDNADCGNIKYVRLGNGTYGCRGTSSNFYVLAIDDLETVSGPHPDSHGLTCTDSAWNSQLAGYEWVVSSISK